MTDIYNEAIHATMEQDDIRKSWSLGGETIDPMQLDALLFRSCPNMGCCLTEFKRGMGDISGNEEDETVEVQQVLNGIIEDYLIPTNVNDLQRDWNAADEEQRLAILERFAIHNRLLDEVFDRDPVDIQGE